MKNQPAVRPGGRKSKIYPRSPLMLQSSLTWKTAQPRLPLDCAGQGQSLCTPSTFCVPVLRSRFFRHLALMHVLLTQVLDAIKSKRLSSFLVKNKLLGPDWPPVLASSQDGQPHNSLSMWHMASKTRLGSASVSVFLDFQKAFNKVWHEGRLLFKLACCRSGVSHDALSWFESYFLDWGMTMIPNLEWHLISTGVLRVPLNWPGTNTLRSI